MSEYDNTNSGVLFKNDKKLSDNHPDYKGTININGVEFWLSSWIKTAQSGSKFMSLAVTQKEQQAPAPVAQTAPAPVQKDEFGHEQSEEVPF